MMARCLGQDNPRFKVPCKAFTIPQPCTYPDRDVFFLLSLEEGEKATIRVSSKFSSLATFVFAAMFSSNYSEGNALLSLIPKQIPLHEDDVEAMTWICQLLHCQPNVDTMPSLAFAGKVTVLCDQCDLHVLGNIQ